MPLTPWLSHYKTDFELARRRRGESIQFDDLRCEAFDRFLLLGFPTMADYAWRLTDITSLVESNFTLASKPQSPVLERLCQVELVFLNGYFVPEASSTAGLNGRAIVGPLLPLLHSDSGDLAPYFANIARIEAAPFVALNTALFEEGAAVIIPPGTVLETPIHLRFLCNGEADAKPAMSQPRSLIVIGDASRATVVESYWGTNSANYFTNAVTEVYVGERAALHHQRIQGESSGAHHIGTMYAVCARGAECTSTTVTARAMLARTETAVLLGGEGARCKVTGFYIAGQRRHVDTHTVIDHAMPACASSQRYTGVVAAGGRGVFSGQNIVRPDAEKLTTESIRVQRLTVSHTREFQAFRRAILNRVPAPLHTTVRQLLESAVQTLTVPTNE